MYRKILVALENSETDQSLLPHITELAKLVHPELLLVHVADGWVARNYDQLQLADSEEMKQDRAYLEATAQKLRAEKIKVSTYLALGDPPTEILKTAEGRKFYKASIDWLYSAAPYTHQLKPSLPLF